MPQIDWGSLFGAQGGAGFPYPGAGPIAPFLNPNQRMELRGLKRARRQARRSGDMEALGLARQNLSDFRDQFGFQRFMPVGQPSMPKVMNSSPFQGDSGDQGGVQRFPESPLPGFSPPGVASSTGTPGAGPGGQKRGRWRKRRSGQNMLMAESPGLYMGPVPPGQMPPQGETGSGGAWTDIPGQMPPVPWPGPPMDMPPQAPPPQMPPGAVGGMPQQLPPEVISALLARLGSAFQAPGSLPPWVGPGGTGLAQMF